MASSTFPCAARISPRSAVAASRWSGRGRGLLREAVGFGEATLLEPDARDGEQRRRAVRPLNGEQDLLGCRVVRRGCRIEPRGEPAARRDVRRRRRLRASRTVEAATAPRVPTAPGDRLVS